MPQKTFERLLRLLELEDSDAFLPLLKEAERRGEVGGIVDLPFKNLCKILDIGTAERDLDKIKAVLKYSDFLGRLWAALNYRVFNWTVALGRGSQDWAQLVPRGKWHQLEEREQKIGRCGTEGPPPFVGGPSPLADLGLSLEGEKPPLLCGRCFTQAKKNWKEVREIDNLGVEKVVQKLVKTHIAMRRTQLSYRSQFVI